MKRNDNTGRRAGNEATPADALRNGPRWKPTVVALALVIPVVLAIGQGVPQPVLRIQPLGTNRMQLTITNGVSWAAYELYRRTTLDSYAGTAVPIYPWSLQLTGAQGQVVFTPTNSTEQVSFFQVAVGNDWDGDGVPNGFDGQPASTNAGYLSITIDFPLDNGTLP